MQRLSASFSGIVCLLVDSFLSRSRAFAKSETMVKGLGVNFSEVTQPISQLHRLWLNAKKLQSTKLKYIEINSKGLREYR